MTIDGRKRFIIAIVSIITQGIVVIAYTACAVINCIPLSASSNIIAAAIVGITAIAGGYLGVQTITDVNNTRRAINNEPQTNR